MSWLVVARHPNGGLIFLQQDDSEDPEEFHVEQEAVRQTQDHPFFANFPSQVIEVDI